MAALGEQQRRRLDEWVQAKGITACAACGREAFGVAALLLLPEYAAWRRAVPTRGVSQGATRCRTRTGWGIAPRSAISLGYLASWPKTSTSSG